MLPQRPRPPSGALPHRSQGVSLIVVMVLLVVIAGLGFAAVQISLMGERSARNDRDYQVVLFASMAFGLNSPENKTGDLHHDSL